MTKPYCFGQLDGFIFEMLGGFIFEMLDGFITRGGELKNVALLGTFNMFGAANHKNDNKNLAI